MGFYRATVWLLLVAVANNAQSGLASDLTLLRGRDSVMCVAGPNMADSAVALITPLHWKTPFLVREYIGAERSGCDFERGESCSTYIYSSSAYELSNSFQFMLAPVTDPRWEKLPVIYTSGNKWIQHNISRKQLNSLNVGVSVRTSSSAHLCMCGDAHCYLVIMKYSAIHLQKCPHNPNWHYCHSCETVTSVQAESEVSELTWTHLSVHVDQMRTVTVAQLNSARILTYRDGPHPVYVQQVHFGSETAAAWKVHDYDFLQLIKTGESIHITTSRNSDYIQMSISVAVCAHCNLTLELLGSTRSTYRSVLAPSPSRSNFTEWQEIQLEMLGGLNAALQVKAESLLRNQPSGFWAIDNIRFAYNKATCSISMHHRNWSIDREIVSCIALRHPEWQVKVSNNADDSFQPGRDGHFFGSGCDESCQRVIGVPYCDRHAICQLSRQGGSRCTCAAGFTGYPSCDQKCERNRYGYNCAEKCGNCHGGAHCNTYTGRCSMCTEGYKQDFFCKHPLNTVLNPTYESTSTSIRITWDGPGYRKGVTTYRTAYHLTGYINCTSKVTRWAGNTTIVKITQAVLDHLHPYANYRITVQEVAVAAVGKPSVTDAQTKATDTVEDNELTTDMILDTRITNVTISWTPAACDKRKGPAVYHIQLLCQGDSWCESRGSQTIDAHAGRYTITGLIPFTRYRLTLNASRPRSNKFTSNLHRNFTTAVNEPPAARELSVYSRSEGALWLRWRSPYPPYGRLQHYLLQWCPGGKAHICGSKTLVPGQHLPECDLWPGFSCFCITEDLQAETSYTLYVSAKNADVNGFGPAASQTTTTEQSISGAPINLTYEWSTDKLILHWSHPSITNGPLTHFLIRLRQAAATQPPSTAANFTYTFNFTKEEKSYRYEVNEFIPLSSTYNVSLCGVNQYMGTNTWLQVISPPVMLALAQPELLTLILTSNSTLSLQIPRVLPDTDDTHNYIYVVVVNDTHPSSSAVRHRVGLESELLNQTGQATTDAWVAMELKPSDSDGHFTVGDGRNSTSRAEPDVSLVNRPLSLSNESYDVYVILMSQYSGQRRYHVYRVLSSVPDSHPALYTFTLLLLLPVLILSYTYR